MTKCEEDRVQLIHENNEDVFETADQVSSDSGIYFIRVFAYNSDREEVEL